MEICVPVPVKATVCGLVGALSLNVNVPLRTPIRVGVKVTLTVQLAPGATVVPQVLLPMVKSPLMLILLTLSVPAPVFVSVTTFAGLVVPSTLLPEARLVADSVTAGVECTALPTYRASAKSARALTVAPPATTILPSGCTAMENGRSLPPAKSVVTLPLAPKLVSSVPLPVNLARAKSYTPPTRVCPTAIIFPSDCRATAEGSDGTSSAPAKSVVTLPLAPKVVSSVPLVLYRARAKSKPLFVKRPAAPATTILPSGWTATDPAWSLGPPKSVVTRPAVPKLESSVPLLL